MGKRPRVPAALHSELSEYSSLLRALRTNDTLDLASQLTAPPPPTLVSTHDADGEADSSNNEKLPTSSPIVSASGSRASSSKSARKGKPKKDTWTRWPLLAGDVHVPEWNPEDEVKLLALHALRRDPLLSGRAEGEREIEHEDESPPATTEDSSMSSADSEPPEEEPTDVVEHDPEDLVDFENLLTPQYLANLTSSAGLHLTRILALLAAYVPPGEKSMQNRVHPIGWQSVLDIVAVNGLIDAGTVERVKRRLLTLYPASSSGQIHMYLDDGPLRRACAAYDDSVLSIDGYEPEPSARKRKRGLYKQRKRRVQR